MIDDSDTHPSHTGSDGNEPMRTAAAPGPFSDTRMDCVQLSKHSVPVADPQSPKAMELYVGALQRIAYGLEVLNLVVSKGLEPMQEQLKRIAELVDKLDAQPVPTRNRMAYVKAKRAVRAKAKPKAKAKAKRKPR